MKRESVHIYRACAYEKRKLKEIMKDFFNRRDFYGKRILLKPNMLQAHLPDENVTTHPLLLRAAAETVMDFGGICAIGDSPSGWGRENVLNAAEKTGIMGICRDLDIKFEVFDGSKTTPVKIKKSAVYNKMHLPENYLSYDTVINVPKLKTHSLTIFTLGVKNMLGVIPGLSKSAFHKDCPHPERFALAIADLYSLVKPDFTILDAVEAMEGDGPVTGDTVKLNRIFCSSSTNSLDAVVEKMCGVDPFRVPITREVYKRGMGEIKDVEIIRHYAENDSRFRSFKVPLASRLGKMIPAFALTLLSPLLDRYPKVENHSCIGCKKCAEVCPADAVRFHKNLPVFKLEKCIRCFCCAERCPQKAIMERKKILARFFS
ncbi:MAG: DUF362 domain-containing protein [Elusimicrobiota bacterium]